MEEDKYPLYTEEQLKTMAAAETAGQNKSIEAAARREQEMLDKPTLFEKGINKIKELFGLKEKEKANQAQQAAQVAAQKQQNSL